MTNLDNIDFRNLLPADFVYEGIVRKIEVEIESYPCQSDEGYGDWVPENWLKRERLNENLFCGIIRRSSDASLYVKALLAG